VGEGEAAEAATGDEHAQSHGSGAFPSFNWMVESH
jgi:hypothetical protein